MRHLFSLVSIIVLSCSNPPEDPSSDITTLYNLGARYQLSDPDSINYYHQQIEERNKNGNPVHQAMAYLLKGKYLNRLDSYQESIKAYQQVLNLTLPSSADSLRGKAFSGIGNEYKLLSNYPTAIEYYQKALTIFEQMKWNEGIAGVNSNIAQVFQLKQDIPNAKKHLQLALQALDSQKKSLAYLNTYHTLANVYGMNGELDSAMAIDEHGIIIAKQVGIEPMQSPFLNNKANCFMYSNRFDSARVYFMEALAIDSAHGNTKQIADSYLDLGTLALMQQDLKTAEGNFLHAIELAKKINHRQVEIAAWENMKEMHRRNGEFKLALDAQQNLISVKDSVTNEKTESKIAELQTLYETEKKQQQLAMQTVELSKQKMINIMIIGLIASLVLAGIAFYRRYKTKKDNELKSAIYSQQQQATIQILTAEEKERQRIATDLHDGIGQTMTAAWLNLQALSKRINGSDAEESSLVEKTTGLVGESCAEIRQVSHNMMPNALSRRGLVNALRQFTGQLDNKIISVSLQADDMKLAIDQTTEIILYRVIQECVNNVVKHSGATELDLSLTHDEEGIDILIEDNGNGFDIRDPELMKGIGIQNVRSRIQYLNGTVEWDNTGDGTVVAIHIPNKK